MSSENAAYVYHVCRVARRRQYAPARSIIMIVQASSCNIDLESSIALVKQPLELSLGCLKEEAVLSQDLQFCNYCGSCRNVEGDGTSIQNMPNAMFTA